MAKTNKTDSEVTAHITNPDSLPEFSNFEEEQISFPPYWEAAEGKWFYAMVVMVDERDPEFPRYVCQAELDTPCKKGSKSKKEDEDIIAHKGEYFTLSTYSGLPLDRYVGTRVLVKCIGKRDVGRPQPMWEFSLKVSPEDKKLLVAERKQLAQEAVRRFKESRNGASKQLSSANGGRDI
jgi:hypothetical protein